VGEAALNPEEQFTYKELRTWPEDERWELIHGVPFRMQSPRIIHQQLLLNLATQLHGWFQGKTCEPFIAPVDVLLRDYPDQAEDEVDTVIEPDLLVVYDPDLVKENGVHGAPDWVLEILSPSTTWRDQTEKRALYERHGVKEYWVLNPDALDLAIFSLVDGRFQTPQGASLNESVPVGLFPGLELSLTRP